MFDVQACRIWSILPQLRHHAVLNGHWDARWCICNNYLLCIEKSAYSLQVYGISDCTAVTPEFLHLIGNETGYQMTKVQQSTLALWASWKNLT